MFPLKLLIVLYLTSSVLSRETSPQKGAIGSNKEQRLSFFDIFSCILVLFTLRLSVSRRESYHQYGILLADVPGIVEHASTSLRRGALRIRASPLLGKARLPRHCEERSDAAIS